MAAFPLEIWDYPGKLKKVVNQIHAGESCRMTETR